MRSFWDQWDVCPRTDEVGLRVEVADHIFYLNRDEAEELVEAMVLAFVKSKRDLMPTQKD